MQVGLIQIARFDRRGFRFAAVEAMAAMLCFIAATRRERKRVIDARHPAQVGRQIPDLLDDEMYDAARMLHLAPAANHSGAKNWTAILFEDCRPHDQIGVGGFILKSEEHDAFGRARHLTDQDKAGD